MKTFKPCDVESCFNFREFAISKRKQFIDIAIGKQKNCTDYDSRVDGTFNGLLACLICSNFNKIDISTGVE